MFGEGNKPLCSASLIFINHSHYFSFIIIQELYGRIVCKFYVRQTKKGCKQCCTLYFPIKKLISEPSNVLSFEPYYHSPH